jgi:hypothetical protein
MCSFPHYSCVTGIARADLTQLLDAGCQWRLAQLTSIFDQGPFENRRPPKSHAENAGSPNLRSGRADLGTTVAIPNTVAKINVTVSMISRSVLYINVDLSGYQSLVAAHPRNRFPSLTVTFPPVLSSYSPFGPLHCQHGRKTSLCISSCRNWSSGCPC